jgi:protein SCO1/2
MLLRLLLTVTIVLLANTELDAQDNTPYQFKDVGITTQINRVLDRPIILYDSFNKPIDLNSLVGNKPTIINFVYLNCPLLCHLMLDGLLNVIQESDYEMNTDFQVVSISIDPNETNKNLLAYKTKYLDQLNQNTGWFFLRGTQDQIDVVTEFFGYHYNYIKRTNDFAHPSVIYFYNNKISNYIEGVTFDKKFFDYSLINIKSTKTIKEKIVTFCYYFDPESQTYSLLIFKILRIICLITVLLLSILITWFLYKERKMKRH